MTSKINSPKNRRPFILIVESILHMVLNVGFMVFIGYAVIFELANFKVDTFGFTNYGFAIMIGISSVCFSWARNILTIENTKALILIDLGADSLYGAIIFLMGSAFKYAIISAKSNEFLSTMCSDFSITYYVIKGLAFICFVFAVFCFNTVITDLVNIINMTRNREWNEEREANERKEREAKFNVK